ncbi:MAG: hypothetical protein WB502_07665, partial [Thermoactinomyces sp.]
MKIKVLAIFFTALFIGLALFLFNLLLGGRKTLNENIPDNKNSAKELVKIAAPYVQEYWDDRKYYIGEIIMELNNNQEGKVEIWYKDDRGEGSEEVPNILTVSFDTKKNKILEIIEQPRDSKIEPGKINIEDWPIDSNEAIQIAKDTFKNDKDFNFTSAFITGSDIYRNGIE